MSSSPDHNPVIRGDVADSAAAARFAIDLRKEVPVDSNVVERVKQQARTAGYAEGWAQGQRDAQVAVAAAAESVRVSEVAHDQRRVAALAQAVNALGRAVADLESQQLMPTFTELQEVLLAYAFELAEAIVGRTVEDPQGRVGDALRRVMSTGPDTGALVINLHPDDFQTLIGPSGETDFDYEGRLVSLRSDASLQPGDATAETHMTTVDATIATAVERAREALRL